MSTKTPEGLAALEARIARDLAMISHPEPFWVPETRASSGERLLDVLVVGGGQSGLATAFQLYRERVNNILVIDRAAEGLEGPWLTYARMPTLRSPKNYTGPDLDIPSLTYQSWHEAQFGAQSWADLDLIPRTYWADYLIWYRRVLKLPVRNGIELLRIVPGEGHLEAHVRDAAGESVLRARKIVLATGQDGTGRWWMPDFVSALPTTLRSHSADDIDFSRLAGKRVGVLGAGASAVDNAATALEAGAAEVHLFCRRSELQRVQPYRWLTFSGFLRHLGDLDDEWRWRFMSYALGLREGFPQPTYERVMRQPAFHLRTGVSWTGAKADGAGVLVETSAGPEYFDHLICGTGIDVDFSLRPEFTGFADQVALWSDRYTPPDEERDDRLARYPYLGSDYQLMERKAGAAPYLADIHCFNIGSTMSFGPSGSSINAMKIAIPRLVAGVTKGLFEADKERLYADFRAYDVKLFRTVEEMTEEERKALLPAP